MYLQVQSLINFIIGILIEEAGAEIINKDKVESRLIPAIEYINRQYKSEIRLKELSALCYLSENYFHNLFKTAFGITPFNYVLQLRMDEIVRLLSNTSMTIKEIAEEMEFKDVAYLTRTFSKYFGISPGRFRDFSEKRIP